MTGAVLSLDPLLRLLVTVAHGFALRTITAVGASSTHDGLRHARALCPRRQP